MAFVHAFIPAGFSSETKKLFVERTKQIMCEAFEFPPAGVSVWLSEFEPDCMCEHAARKNVLYAYTTVGKTKEQKNRAAMMFEQVCSETFGDKKGDTFIIFKEHNGDNLCVRGMLKSLNPNAAPVKK